MQKIFAPFILLLALAGCAQTDDNSVAIVGPSAVAQWSQVEYAYLGEIAKAELSASEFISEDAYVTLGHFACDTLEADKSAEEVLASVVAIAAENQIAQSEQIWFSSTVIAAAITHMCPTEQFTTIQ